MPIPAKKPPPRPLQPWKPKTIGIVGSRRRNGTADRLALAVAFDEVYEAGDRIVSGGCPAGADRFAEDMAKSRGITIVVHYPRREALDPELLGVDPRAAWAKIFHARNSLIARDADILLAVVAPDRLGGAEDAVRKVERMGKRVVIV